MTDSLPALMASLSWVQPELLLIAFAMIGVLIGAIGKDRAAGLLALLGGVVLVAAGVLALFHRPVEPMVVFEGFYRVDGFSAIAKAVIAFAAAATLFLGADYFARTKEFRFEFPILTTLSVLGMFVMASANDLIGLYLGLEMQSLAAYVLAAFRRDEARSSEAGLKYFVLGALSSGLLLYGASLVYGFAGSVRFSDIAAAAAAADAGGNPGLVFGLVFLLCGLAFKLSAAPFHMWTPDVYEGAPIPVTALFAGAPKMAAVALFARVLYGPFEGMEEQWRQVVIALAFISLAWGSIAALIQTNVKRLMAYSSIANMGFVLTALAAGTAEGASGALLYMVLYLPATIGALAIFSAMRRDAQPVEQIADLAGLARRQPLLAALLTVFFFSLIGLPPLAGFFGKIYVFRACLDAGLWPLAIAAALATVAGAGYYLKVLASVWFQPPAPEFDRAGPVVSLTATTAAVLTFPVLIAVLALLEQMARTAAASF
jgi:NADH-quinone oxidoreductase subunit N